MLRNTSTYVFNTLNHTTL